MVNRRLTLAPRSRRRAVALIDAIVAAIILGVALSLIVSITGQAIGSQTAGERMQTAAMLADEQLNLMLARGPDDYARRYKLTGACDAPYQDFTYAIKILEGANAAVDANAVSGTKSSSGAYRVSVTITWKTIAKTEQSVTVETLLAPRLGEEPDPVRIPETTPIRLQ